VYASVRVRGLTCFHVALVQFVLSAGNGDGGQAMRRAGHARLARTFGRSLPNPFVMRIVEIDRAIAVHGRAEAGCPLSDPERRSTFPPFPKIPNPSGQRVTYLYLVTTSS
jgi:hypothetical protein